MVKVIIRNSFIVLKKLLGDNFFAKVCEVGVIAFLGKYKKFFLWVKKEFLSQNLMELWPCAQSFSKKENFVNTSKRPLETWKLELVSKKFVCGCLWTQFSASNSIQSPSNLIYLTVLVTLRSFNQFSSKIRRINLQKSVKICLS